MGEMLSERELNLIYQGISPWPDTKAPKRSKEEPTEETRCFEPSLVQSAGKDHSPYKGTKEGR